ncbi:MAG: hypothetical protein CM15mP120_28180 [Pseudomonadota bacterium]|nr:MAG: hypothetical protein CM15mP120_28180 [Pseudomonadota bacterium]
MNTVLQGNERISSTLVRSTLANGDFEKATTLLGHEYFIMGRVVYGRSAWTPAWCADGQCEVAAISRMRWKGVLCHRRRHKSDGSALTGIANIGVRPTVDGKSHC